MVVRLVIASFCLLPTAISISSSVVRLLVGSSGSTKNQHGVQGEAVDPNYLRELVNYRGVEDAKNVVDVSQAVSYVEGLEGWDDERRQKLVEARQFPESNAIALPYPDYQIGTRMPERIWQTLIASIDKKLEEMGKNWYESLDDDIKAAYHEYCTKGHEHRRQQPSKGIYRDTLEEYKSGHLPYFYKDFCRMSEDARGNRKAKEELLTKLQDDAELYFSSKNIRG